MIFLSAQPDDLYFTWQLEIQLRNLRDLNIHSKQIQVLIAYNPLLGVKPVFKEFMDNNQILAQFFTYPDTREQKGYTSSIRPNILKQHFKAFPELANEVIFYHDSDILFSRIPEIDDLYEDQICYVSDTRSYLDSGYVKSASSEMLLEKMADAVGIPTEAIYANDPHTGGAQYILKSVDSVFWEKVEEDSEKLYALMKEYNTEQWVLDFPKTKRFRNEKKGIQAWCADMWAVLWNLWYSNKQVQIHSEMDFSWPHSSIDLWKKCSILHYSGSQKDRETIFKKTDYINYLPWYEDSLGSIPDTNCSYPIVQAITSRKAELDTLRKPLLDTCFVLMVDVLDEEHIELLSIAKRYLLKYFDCHIKICMNKRNVGFDVHHLSLKDEVILSYKDLCKYVIEDNDVIENYVFCSVLTFMSKKAIAGMLAELRFEPKDALLFKPRLFYQVDLVFIEAFSKVLDEQLFLMNLGKFNSKKEKIDGTLFIKKDLLLNIGEFTLYEELIDAVKEYAKPAIASEEFELFAFTTTK